MGGGNIFAMGMDTMGMGMGPMGMGATPAPAPATAPGAVPNLSLGLCLGQTIPCCLMMSVQPHKKKIRGDGPSQSASSLEAAPHSFSVPRLPSVFAIFFSQVARLDPAMNSDFGLRAGQSEKFTNK